MAINYQKLRKDLEEERKRVQKKLNDTKAKHEALAHELAELRQKNQQLKNLQDNLPREAYDADPEWEAKKKEKLEIAEPGIMPAAKMVKDESKNT